LLDWVHHLKFDFTPYDNVNAWSERCGSRPIYKKISAEEHAGAAAT
jgi:glutathione S-transferase